MSEPTRPLTLYWHPLSGHSHRVQLFLSLTGLPFELKHIELTTAEQRGPEYLKVNPQGKLPALDDNGTIVTDSSAILVYLATRYDAARPWLPTTALELAEVIRHLVFAAGPGEFGPGDARLINLTGGDPKLIQHLDAKHVDAGVAARIAQTWLARLDTELRGRTFLVGDRVTIADVANYTAIAYAPEGGIDISPYANVRVWLGRIEALPGFVPMQTTPIGLRQAA